MGKALRRRHDLNTILAAQKVLGISLDSTYMYLELRHNFRMNFHMHFIAT